MESIEVVPRKLQAPEMIQVVEARPRGNGHEQGDSLNRSL
jgi:hypothetical protein